MNLSNIAELSQGSQTSLFPIVKRYLPSHGNCTDWNVEVRSEGWIHISKRTKNSPSQGWKLHVSANRQSAMDVLSRVLPILFFQEAEFKITSSLSVLDDINEGSGGLSQIGKFITIYPEDDTSAVRLALALDKATTGLCGPIVPSDLPLGPGSLVHYRYGGFDGRHLQTPLGEIVSAISTPGGSLVPDRRSTFYSRPDWVADPFRAAGIETERANEKLIAARYLPICIIDESARGKVYLAVDVSNPRRCVLKQARRGLTIGPNRIDSCDRLRHEADVLARFAGDLRFPQKGQLSEHEGDLYLAIDDIEGETLESHIGNLASNGLLLSRPQLIRLARELVATVGTIHAKGLVYRDLKSSNVIIGSQGQVRLIDFELAESIGQVPRYGRGTRGYISRQQSADLPAAVADDVYGVGAMLYFAATGAEPSLAPDSFDLLKRPLELLNSDLDADIARVIRRCLHEDQELRFPTMFAIDQALADIPIEPPIVAPQCKGLSSCAKDRGKDYYRALAKRLGDSLCSIARRDATPDERICWISTHESREGVMSRDLSAGNAGSLLALSELVLEFEDPEHRHILIGGAEWLRHSRGFGGSPLPGLFVGEAGVGAALLRCGQVLRSKELVADAAKRGHWISTLPYSSPDVFNGTAGRILFHLLLWDETAEPEHLRDAHRAGEVILSLAESVGKDGVRWRIPDGYNGLSGPAYLGYAHGAAGVGDVLLDLFEATGDDRFLSCAQKAANWLMQNSVTVLHDRSGTDWPAIEGEKPGGAFWCHGATGVGQFFLHASALQVIKGAEELARRAAYTVSRATRWAGPTQCHGLAGNIEFLLDVAVVTGDNSWVIEATSQADLLESFRLERDGMLTWSSESPDIVTPDYMVGYAGVASCLLRLADPKRFPRQLSRAGFRRKEAVIRSKRDVVR